MSIEIFVDACENNHELYEVDPKTGVKTLGAVPTVLGIYLNTIGVHQITPKNSEEVFLRLEMLARVDGGGPFVRDGKDYKLTLDHVERCIGLRVNTVEQTRTAFERNLTVWLRERAKKELARQRQRQALEARGYLLGFDLKTALLLCLRDNLAHTLDEARQEIVGKWGPDDWIRAFETIAPRHHWTIGSVAEANGELRRLTEAFDLSTPVTWLLDRNRELVREAKRAKRTR